MVFLSGQCPAVVIDLVDLTGGEDYEFRAGRPPGPVSSRAPDRSELESSCRRHWNCRNADDHFPCAV